MKKKSNGGITGNDNGSDHVCRVRQHSSRQPDSGCTGECRHGNRGSKDRKRQRKCCGRRNHIDCVGTIYRIRRRCAA